MIGELTEFFLSIDLNAILLQALLAVSELFFCKLTIFDVFIFPPKALTETIKLTLNFIVPFRLFQVSFIAFTICFSTEPVQCISTLTLF